VKGVMLRDYFAAKAMSGILAGPTNFILRGKHITYGESEVAELAYCYADAMLQWREKKKVKVDDEIVELPPNYSA